MPIDTPFIEVLKRINAVAKEFSYDITVKEFPKPGNSGGSDWWIMTEKIDNPQQSTGHHYRSINELTESVMSGSFETEFKGMINDA